MLLRRSVTTALAGLLALAPGAGAQSGTGLYEPFPDGIRKDHAVLFVERLGLGEGPRRTIDDLERGEFVRSADPVAAVDGRGASRRAGVSSDGEGLPAPAELALLAAALLALPLLATRRRRARVAAR